MKNQLHPGARWLFRIYGYIGAIILLMFVGNFFAAFIFSIAFGTFSGTTIISYLIVYLVLMLIIGEIYARMAYNRWFYEFTADNLKIEKGIIWKKYSNIPYERVQNVDVTRGILARIFGFSTLNIQTAGYSFTSRGIPASEGYIPAVSIEAAEKIRNFLMKKIGKRSRQGL